MEPIMSVLMGPESQAMCANWRLGPDDDPGLFDTSACDCTSKEFVLATVFSLHWHLLTDAPDGIHNLLHAVTMGRADRAHKTHLEQLAQILGGQLHVTCRSIDSTGLVSRNTVALPGSWQHYQGIKMLLIYRGRLYQETGWHLWTQNVLYDLDNSTMLQHLEHIAVVQDVMDFDFVTWPAHRVICDHEQFRVPRNHVMIHGNHVQQPKAHTPFELLSVWGSLDRGLDPLDWANRIALGNPCPPDLIGHTSAWYNCSDVNNITHGGISWMTCGGRYQQKHSLGIKITQST
jgi:hypothetical protein